MLAIADWESNGQWDASHSQDPGSVRDYWLAHGHPTDARELVRMWWESDCDDPTDWIAQQDPEDLGTRDPREAYAAWRNGWQGYAARCVATTRIPEWETEYQERMADLVQLIEWQKENGIAHLARDLAEIAAWRASQRNR